MLFILFSSIAAMALAEDMKNLRFLEKDNGEISIRNLSPLDEIAEDIWLARKRLVDPEFLRFVFNAIHSSVPASNAAKKALAAFNPNVPETYGPKEAIFCLSTLLIFCPKFVQEFRNNRGFEGASNAITMFLHENTIVAAADIIIRSRDNIDFIKTLTREARKNIEDVYLRSWHPLPPPETMDPYFIAAAVLIIPSLSSVSEQFVQPVEAFELAENILDVNKPPRGMSVSDRVNYGKLINNLKEGELNKLLNDLKGPEN